MTNSDMPAGDQVLCQVAERLRANLRAVDLLARIGGEEFLVVMPETDACAARLAAERLAQSIRCMPFRAGDPAMDISVTLSIGIRLSDEQVCDEHSSAQSETQADTDSGTLTNSSLDRLIKDADAALYAAKNAGRDTVSLSAA